MPNRTEPARPTHDHVAPRYVSPKDLVERWRCSRASVHRIARDFGSTRLCLGNGRNGMVRYPLEEVEAFEARNTVPGTPSKRPDRT